MDDRKLTSGIAAGRIAFGALCMAAPRLIVGRGGVEVPGQAAWMVRAFGTRDMVLGAGTLMAMAEGGEAKRWIVACAVADTVDAVTAVAFRRELGPQGTAATLGLAIPAALVGWKAALAPSNAS